MPVNKVVYGSSVLVDLTSDTVDAEHLAEGYTATDRSGNKITGTMTGGLPSGFSAIAKGTYTFTSDMTGNSSTTSTTYQKTITHGLGVVPDLIIFYAPNNVAQTYSMLGMAWGNSIMNWRSSSYKCNVWLHGNSTTTVTGSSCNATYGIRNVTATQFSLKTYSSSTSYFWRAGTYEWIAIKF